MESTPNTPEVHSAVGIKAMNWAMHPALIINPAAAPRDLFSWAVAELDSLHNWLDIGACSSCGFDLEPPELAALVAKRLVPVLQGLRAALDSGSV